MSIMSSSGFHSRVRLGAAFLCTFLVTAFGSDTATKSRNAPKIAPASKNGEVAIKTFRVPKELRVELVAAEPFVANPVAFWIDERGRFYVAETFRCAEESRE